MRASGSFQPPEELKTAQPARLVVKPRVSSDPLVVKLTALGEEAHIDWISDDETSHRQFRTLQPDHAETIKANKRIRFLTHDAGALQVTVNGMPIGPIGSKGGLREFLVTPTQTEILPEPSGVLCGMGGSPVLLSSVEPEYSEEARAAKYQGTVSLFFRISKDGKAENIQVKRSVGKGLDEKAIECVRRWLFRPAMNSCGPTNTVASADINFRLL
jgi:TonB family protein